jgi:hypothetical protein
MPLTIGDVLPFAVTVRDAAGALANAGAMTLTVTLPDGTAASGSPFTVSSTTTGAYDKDVLSTQAGRYTGYWLATGLNAGAHTQVFDVAPAADEAIVSLADAKAHLNMTGTSEDEEIQAWLAAITPIVEQRVGAVIPRTHTEQHTAGRSLWLRNPPVISLTSVAPLFTTGGTTYLPADLIVSTSGRVRRGDGSAFTGGPYTVTYLAGRRVIPANITQAVLVILKHLWETQRGASRLPLQSEDDTQLVPGFGFAVPNRAMELLEPDRLLFGYA